VAQDLGDSFEVDSLAQHLAGCRVPEDMRPTPRRLDTGSPQGRTSDMADPLPGLPHGEGLEGGVRAQENELARNPGASRSQVLEEGITDILW
jgi:hypothetical protein